MVKKVGGTALDSQFWQSYKHHLTQICIHPQHIPYYVNWCRSFVKFLGDLSLVDCQPEHVSAFLDTLRANDNVNKWQVDQNFLREMIYPMVYNKSCVHDEFYEYKPFPTKRVSDEFVGAAFNADETPCM